MSIVKYFPAMLSTVLFLCCLPPLAAIDSPAVHLEIMGLEAAGPPRILDNYLLLTYEGEATYVGVRFAHEDYKELHVFSYNQHDLFFLLYPLPPGVGRLQYRMVVDGVWMADPWNPRREKDVLGTAYSVFLLPAVIEKTRPGPVVKGRVVTFFLQFTPGKSIYLAGDFNAYDPYLYKLEETKPGLYELALQISPGEHGYYFLVNGYPYLDPRNPRRKLDTYNREVSWLQVD